jgi:hypothetical protein
MTRASPLFPDPATHNSEHAGWMFEVVFDYGEHDADAPTPGMAPANGPWPRRSLFVLPRRLRGAHHRLCQRVLMFHHFPDETGVGNDCLVRSTDFTYSHEQDPTSARNPVYTFLQAVTQSATSAKDGGYLKRSLPPVEFEYSQPIVQDVGGGGGCRQPGEPAHRAGRRGLPVDRPARRGHPRHPDRAGRRLVLQAQPQPDQRKSRERQWRTCRGEIRPVELVATSNPTSPWPAARSSWTWPATASRIWWCWMAPCPASTSTTAMKAGSLPPLHLPPQPRHRDPNLKFVDLDGDGHADVLITEDDAFVWHASLAEAGFGPARRVAQALDEEKGPRLVFADGTQSIYLADLSGDGLTDLARIRNGEVCYWPNLGYGRFGAKVTMDHAPHFDTRTSSTRSASAWPTSTAAAPPTSSTCTATACASTSTSPATAGASRSLSVFPARGRPGQHRHPSTCSATAPPAWSGHRRCRAMRGGRCATST